MLLVADSSAVHPTRASSSAPVIRARAMRCHIATCASWSFPLHASPGAESMRSSDNRETASFSSAHLVRVRSRSSSRSTGAILRGRPGGPAGEAPVHLPPGLLRLPQPERVLRADLLAGREDGI